jgi:type VI secretion system protein ImpL
MKSMFKLRTLLIIAGVVLLALFIWYGGPLIAFGSEGQYRPLASELVRLIVIALVIVALVISHLLKRLRANKNSDNLMAAVVKQSQGADARPSAEARQLRERFEEAVAALKQKRRSGHTLYELPWYVIIGAPGSGKTTALVNSGLKFPIEQRSGKAALRGVGGTRNCDWWFTDDAVLIDTAGRYTTQDSDASADSAAWSEFLALLRKYRGRRPINGVILTISAQDLMVQSASARETHVDAARRRLDELNRELRMRLPVYLMVTKCDLVAGFTEYFDDQAQQGRAQIWGVTFAYDDTANGRAAPTFPTEFDGLIARLNERLMPRLEEERDVRRRAKVFGFPQQMAALRESLSQFVSEVFSSTRFDRQLLLRGVYFTSGTQEGTPIDRLLGALSRQFAMAESLVASRGKGKAYFIERLLTDVIFAESGLAGVNRRVEVQKAALQLSAYVAMLLVGVIGLIGLTTSYRSNRNYLMAIDQEVGALRAAGSDGGTGLDSQLSRLDGIRAVSDSADRYTNDPPWSMRWGLFQGESVGTAARDAYARALNGVFLPEVTGRFKQRLSRYAAEPEKLYEYLKAYLMLGDPKRLDREQLQFLAEQEWDASYGSVPQIRDSVATHFRSLLESGKIGKRTPDETIVAQTRNTLLQASKAGLVYRYLRSNYVKDTGRALRLDVEAGAGVERVLRRKTGVSLSMPLPSLYTKDVFNEVVSTGMNDLVKQFAEEQWVWGKEAPNLSNSATLRQEVLDVYEKDYIAFWDRIVQEIELVPFGAASNTKETVAIVSGPTSPLRGMYKAIDKHTYLVAPQEPAKDAASGVKDRLSSIFGNSPVAAAVATTKPGAQITMHFAEIHRLVAGDAGAAPIDGTLRTMQQLQQKMAPVGTNVGEGPADANTVREISEITSSLKRDAASLPPALGAIVTGIANGSLSVVVTTGSDAVSKNYAQTVLSECRLLVNGRYPFEAGSSTDIPIADFERLFGPNGVYDMFFKSDLQSRVNTTRSPWTWLTDASGAPVGRGIPLAKFEAAERIRQMFFRAGSSKAEIRFTVTPVSLAPADPGASFALEIDGQRIPYQFGPERPYPVTWPGPKPGQATATFSQSGGPNAAFDGPWAWFRLVDSGQMVRQGNERFMFTIKRGTREAQLRIEPDMVRNPFAGNDLQRFRCE